MGILNVTPDSFSDGGLHDDPDEALRHAERMIKAGATVLDIGGESTRPGSMPVPAEEEIRRTLPVIKTLRRRWDGWISIDTMKASVARAALSAGADVVNDVSGLTADPEMPEACAESECAVVVMHMQGRPETMQQTPHYTDVTEEVRGFFHERFESLARHGIKPDHMVFDPGIGFGKTLEHNLALLRSLDRLAPAGRPVLLGVSRKSFIGQVLGEPSQAFRDWPTVALTASAREHGVMLHRVHDVSPNLDALRMVEAIMRTEPA